MTGIPETAQQSRRQLGWLLACLAVASYVLSHLDGGFRIAAVLGFAILVFWIYRSARLRPADIGLSREAVSGGLRWGFGAMAVIAVVLCIALLIQPEAFMDERYRQDIQATIFKSLLFIPFATVFFEELVFRGVLPALLQRSYSLKKSIIIASLCFGLWHVFSSAGASSAIFGSDGGEVKILGMLLIVLVTGGAGVLFCLLRFKSQSIIASILAHWGINAFALIAAAIAWRL